MKVLHTSDWHLGQQFYDYSRQQEHQAFLAWLIDALEAEQVDLLLISGDIYHTATPSTQAEQLLYDFVKSAKVRCPSLHIVIIAGNHDSPARIETAKPLLERFDTHVFGRFSKNEPQLSVLRLQIANENAAIIAMPFLRPHDINASQEELSRYEQAVKGAYESALNSFSQQEQECLIVLGHLHAKGGDISQDSERNLSIGGFDSLSCAIFPAQADYVALGHLHKAQQVNGQANIRYSGSPLPLSFSERNYQHQVLLAEFIEGRLSTVKPLYIPRHKEIYLIPDKGALMLDELCDALRQFAVDNDKPTPYLRLKMDARETDSQFRVKIDDAMAHLNVHFCGIERVVMGENQHDEQSIFDVTEQATISPSMLLEFAYKNQVDPEAIVPPVLVSLLEELTMELDDVNL